MGNKADDTTLTTTISTTRVYIKVTLFTARVLINYESMGVRCFAHLRCLLSLSQQSFTGDMDKDRLC